MIIEEVLGKTPPECQTHSEKIAFAFGWFKAMEQIEAAILAEREACAKLCLETGIKHPQQSGQEACAVAIRARGDK